MDDPTLLVGVIIVGWMLWWSWRIHRLEREILGMHRWLDHPDE